MLARAVRQHRAEGDLGRRLDADVLVGGDLQQELAVLRLADLQERQGLGGPDVVALRVEQDDVGTLAGDLAAEDERRRRRRPERLPVRGDDLPRHLPDVQRGFEQVLHRRQVLVLARARQVALDAVEHLLGRRQAARRLEHEHPVGRRGDDVQLAIGPDVVDPGVGAGVGEEEEALVQSHGEAIGHVVSPGFGTKLTAIIAGRAGRSWVAAQSAISPRWPRTRASATDRGSRRRRSAGAVS